MRIRPWPLVILAIAHLVAPVGNLFINAYLRDVTVWRYTLAMFHPNNVTHASIFLGIPVLSAWLIYMCKKWSYWAYLCFMSVPFVYSYMSWRESETAMPLTALAVFYVVNSIVVGYFVLPAVRRVYFDSRLRWWETKPRFGTSYQALISIGEKKFEGYIRNISEGGIFWESQAIFPENEEIVVEFRGAEENFHLKARAIYHRGQEPCGYGIKFDLDPVNMDKLLMLIARLKDEGAVVVGRAPGAEDSFGYWVKTLFKTKAAWIPQTKLHETKTASSADQQVVAGSTEGASSPETLSSKTGTTGT